MGVACLASTPLFAGEAKEVPPQHRLPGVDGAYSIVAPPPPEPDRNPDDNQLHRKIGDWDVTVSGSVSVEIGFGKRTPGGRR